MAYNQARIAATSMPTIPTADPVTTVVAELPVADAEAGGALEPLPEDEVPLGLVAPELALLLGEVTVKEVAPDAAPVPVAVGPLAAEVGAAAPEEPLLEPPLRQDVEVPFIIVMMLENAGVPVLSDRLRVIDCPAGRSTFQVKSVPCC